MPTIYVDDLREALIEANRRFDEYQQGGFPQHFEAGEVEIMNNIVNTRWDYGAPGIWQAGYDVIRAASDLWREMHPNSGVILPPQEKQYLGWQVNFQFRTDNRLFNYHVSVPEPD
ncbi:hypothetical protein [Aliikangiella sp. G2MR2-5]|uniref:hypothetical protein n=1 Tax=Aliikangiella sp. G2MR2-5 TaxID=2788943 RepID=UPI0018AB8EBB|nr:hypothetical protein [Aliikangiella sp. G2MR2-5]